MDVCLNGRLWLTSSYECVFGSLTEKANSVVAAQLLTYFNAMG